jgi:hypothetical protein
MAPKPKPKKDESVRLAEAKANAYMGHLKRKSEKQSLKDNLTQALNPFNGTIELQNHKIASYENAIRLAKANARTTAGDTRNVNPINGPIAGTHNSIGK